MYEDMDTTVVDTQTDITPDDAGQGQETQQDDVQGQISDKLREFIGEVEGEQEKANPETVKTDSSSVLRRSAVKSASSCR